MKLRNATSLDPRQEMVLDCGDDLRLTHDREQIHLQNVHNFRIIESDAICVADLTRRDKLRVIWLVAKYIWNS